MAKKIKSPLPATDVAGEVASRGPTVSDTEDDWLEYHVFSTVEIGDRVEATERSGGRLIQVAKKDVRMVAPDRLRLRPGSFTIS